MSLNRTNQEEIERREAELLAVLVANEILNRFERINLIGNQPYGKPYLPEEEFQMCSGSKYPHSS
jgi:hypothetical protein